MGTADEMFNELRQPYTPALLSSVPELNPHVKKQRKRYRWPGNSPKPYQPSWRM
ncbi:MAG: hypothetical protein ACP5KV_08070 [Candidatus Methanomethylicaceae archaeon]